MRKESSYIDWDWSKIPVGSSFTATIEGKKCEGRIQKEKGRIYLCQDYKLGSKPYDDNTLGYKGSWSIRNGNVEWQKTAQVQNLKVYLPEKGYKVPVRVKDKPITGYEVYIESKCVRVGCTPISFERIQFIYKTMLKLRKNATKK